MSLHKIRVAALLISAPLVMQACLFADAGDYNNAPDLSNNATADMGTQPSDMSSDMGCQADPLDAARACEDAGFQCGDIEITDTCGVKRTTSCGECPNSGEQCNAEQQCECTEQLDPPRACVTETEVGACGNYRYNKGCGEEGVQECSTECPGNLVCDEENNTCGAPPMTCDQAACQAADRACGPLPGCTDFECGVCASGSSCEQGRCVEDAPMCGSREYAEVCGDSGDANERCLSMYARCGTYQSFACRACPGSGCEVQTHCTEFVLPNPTGKVDGFGSQVLVGENLLFVSAPKAGTTGQIYLYRLPFDTHGVAPADTLEGSDLGVGVDLTGSGLKLGFVSNKLVVATPDHNIVSAIPIVNTNMGPRFNRTNVVAVKIGASGDRLGASLGTLPSKNAVIIGAPGYKNSENKETGIAYACVNTVSRWDCTTIDNPARTTNGFGDSVALLESSTMTTPLAVVGEPETAIGAGQSGQVNLFALNPLNEAGWTRLATLEAPTGHINFGANLHSSNGKLYISALNEGSNANSYISEAALDSTQSKLVINEEKLIESGGSYLGEQIAGSSDALVATGRAKSGKEGSAFGFVFSSQTMIELHPSLETMDSSTATSFGASVAMTDKGIIIGAPDHAVSGESVGGVFFLPIPETSDF